jgi:hypothetical protein
MARSFEPSAHDGLEGMPMNSLRPALVATALAGSLITGCAADDPSTPPAPACDAPAPLTGRFDARAPDYFVVYRDGVDTAAETDRLSRQYGLTPLIVYQVIPAFVASFSDEVREQLRCEPSVSYLEYDGIVSGD